MSDKPETLSAILAEFRAFALRAADKVEAAAERERQDAMKTALLAKCKVCEKVGPASAPGNAAAMREALKYIAWESRNAINSKTTGDERASVLAAYLMDFRDKADAALAAPARNCDRFATEDEAREAYWAYREPLEFNGNPFVAITEWLFATAEGGAE